ncbi:MAG TPA: M67 family metallopeptidase [Terriglobales bacterium]|nr:M67 family metallopeptidase [Terriglobales bacterium]
MALEIARPALEDLLRHGERDYPNECCGLLLGQALETRRRRATEAFPMRNANAVSPQNRFEFDPREHLAAQRAARERGLSVVGFYHSHPDHPARPSRTDLERAAWPGYSYLIISVAGGKAAPDQANAFELAEDRSAFLPEPLEVI